MLSALLTGHAQFAGGLYSALAMIAGEQENFEVQLFEENMSMDAFKENVAQKIQALSNGGENEVFIFTDLKGGTPFNVAMLETFECENAYVYAGTNLPMLLEFCGCRMMKLPSDEVEKMILSAGRDGLVTQKLSVAAEEEDDESEGI
ncbi:PTS system, N-acetylgalactosamine-specific IIA component [Pilibacter termitis]|uniref:PTS system, N-acetylgalactosamine-specific IIA component n=1 Tax=Pilibacter termitis TaxID=263852 RepID=A0A1T4KTX2_9ENTE|nr:PTS sugar transporter subunit IIA [Pilibacter termitis]SJZ45894.1 PTS system, N-acetylgalactosamine-specific IIA component [Pilibacter termitis]